MEFIKIAFDKADQEGNHLVVKRNRKLIYIRFDGATQLKTATLVVEAQHTFYYMQSDYPPSSSCFRFKMKIYGRNRANREGICSKYFSTQILLTGKIKKQFTTMKLHLLHWQKSCF